MRIARYLSIASVQPGGWSRWKIGHLLIHTVNDLEGGGVFSRLQRCQNCHAELAIETEDKVGLLLQIPLQLRSCRNNSTEELKFLQVVQTFLPSCLMTFLCKLCLQRS